MEQIGPLRLSATLAYTILFVTLLLSIDIFERMFFSMSNRRVDNTVLFRIKLLPSKFD
jgi:hypothetical protein